MAVIVFKSKDKVDSSLDVQEIYTALVALLSTGKIVIYCPWNISTDEQNHWVKQTKIHLTGPKAQRYLLVNLSSLGFLCRNFDKVYSFQHAIVYSWSAVNRKAFIPWVFSLVDITFPILNQSHRASCNPLQWWKESMLLIFQQLTNASFAREILQPYLLQEHLCLMLLGKVKSFAIFW